MRAPSLSLATALLFFGLVHTVNASLPEECQQLLEKLKAYEAEQAESLSSVVMEKRNVVSEEFKAMAVLETKQGQVERANIISHFQLMLCDSSKEVDEIVTADLDLPDNARASLEKLVDFKKRENAKTQALLKNKRQAVIRVLNTHLQQAQRRGDLDAVNALKKSIEIIGGNRGSARIPDDAVSFNGRHYKIYETDPVLTWEEAREECRKLGGDLGWALGKDGESMLKTLMTPFVAEKGHSPVWVGAYRNRADKWEWLDGSTISDDFWPDDYDRWEAPNFTAMVRWIGSYRAINPEASQPKGFLCMWE